jgi:hypothetical protein
MLIAYGSVFAGPYPADESYRYIAASIMARPGYLVPVRDPVSRAQIIRITDSKAFGTSSVWDLRHAYSKSQIWNCNQTLIRINTRILDGKTYKILRSISTSSDAKWSCKDPNKIFDIAGNRFASVNATTGAYTTLHAFPGVVRLSMGLGEGNISTDDGSVALVPVNADGSVPADTDIIVYHIANNIVCATKKYSTTGLTGELDWVSMSQSGKYVVVQGGGHAASYDRNLNKVAAISFIGHADMGYDVFGNDVYVPVGPVMERLDNGQRTDLPGAGGNLHMSCRNYNRKGWCYPDAGGNIMAVKLDGSVSLVERFTHSRTSGGSDSYSGMSMAVSSPDGKKVMFASDWKGVGGTGGTGEINDYVVGMPDYPFFNSPQSVSVPLGQNLSYAVKYDNTDNLPITITYLKKPAWVMVNTTTNMVTGTAPASFKIDTLIAILNSAISSDTLKLSIWAANYLVKEAESGAISAPMQIMSDLNASGGKYIATPAGTGNSGRPSVEASYPLTIPVSGKYYVWLLMYVPNKMQYGIFAEFNDSVFGTVTSLFDTCKYVWVTNNKVHNLLSGANTLKIGHNREQVRVDKIIVTNSLTDQLPAGLLQTGISNFNMPQRMTPSVLEMTSFNRAINFQVYLNQGGNYSLHTYDISGREIWGYSQKNCSAGLRQIRCDKNILKNGVYMTELTNNNVRSVIKYSIVK